MVLRALVTTVVLLEAMLILPMLLKIAVVFVVPKLLIGTVALLERMGVLILLEFTTIEPSILSGEWKLTVCRPITVPEGPVVVPEQTGVIEMVIVLVIRDFVVRDKTSPMVLKHTSHVLSWIGGTAARINAAANRRLEVRVVLRIAVSIHGSDEIMNFQKMDRKYHFTCKTGWRRTFW